jgi:hypothetical protein
MIKDHVKNIIGWRTDRRIVIFSVDDFGNVRVSSRDARENMEREGLRMGSRFDLNDTLETYQDLEMLFETLGSVKDKNGRHAVFTAFALPCNIDFDMMEEGGYEEYHYEILPVTFSKLSTIQPDAYVGVWELWKKGILEGLIKPQFHGREHFNVKLFSRLLIERNRELMIAMEHRSLACLPGNDAPPGGWTASFGFWDIDDTRIFPEIIRNGLACFREVFGYSATVFTAPAQQFPVSMEKDLAGFGFKAFDRPFYQIRHLGRGKFKRQITFTGYDKAKDLVYLVRNVVFEPTSSNIDHVAKAMQQIETAFRWNRPAIISSHRVNFCGHIDPANRAKGLGDLRVLLKKIVEKWPDVEFMSAGELSDLIRA